MLVTRGALRPKNVRQERGSGYFQSSSSSSSSSESSSSSSSRLSADSSSKGFLPTTLRSAPHSSQLNESPSSTSSSSTSIEPSHTGQFTIKAPSVYSLYQNFPPSIPNQALCCLARRRRVVAGTRFFNRRYMNICAR